KYITIRGKGPVLQELKSAAKEAKKIFLASDPDREGEAIAWHLAHSLGIDENSACRVVFNVITTDAVKQAFTHPRPINRDRVDAQQARRILYRLVGYNISPILWKKVKKGLSAGRVQSVALRLIIDRENEIRNFKPEEYWSITGLFGKGKKEFTATFHGNGKKKIKLPDRGSVDAILAKLDGSDFEVAELEKKERKRN